MKNRGQYPNVLFIILDACRPDFCSEYAPNIVELAESNLWFDNAVAPSRRSFPSHTSLIAGAYPSEHGALTPKDSYNDMDLPDTLRNLGFACYTVSGNHYASERFGIDKGFDRVFNTRGIGNPLGFDIGEASQVARKKPGGQNLGIRIGYVLSAALGSDDIAGAIQNISLAGLNKLSSQFERLESVHPVFDNIYSNKFGYTAQENNNIISHLLDSSGDQPAFVFANYMDTHYPYSPPVHVQREVLGESKSYREIRRLNQEVAYSWSFQEHLATGDLDEGRLETVQQLYAGEVRAVDEKISELLSNLSESGALDHTLVIVTADHGEDLGEDDGRGERRMGHGESVSDNLLKVPLIIAHPDLNSRVVEETVSLTNIADIAEKFDGWFQEAGLATDEVIDTLIPDDQIALSEFPAKGETVARERYPKVPEEYIQMWAFEHTVAGYLDEWKYVCSTSDDRWAWRDDEPAPPEAAPNRLREKCENHLQELTQRASGDNSTDNSAGDAIETQLEKLGYL